MDGGPDFVFDADFYRTFYPDLHHLDVKSAVAHWKERGRTEGRFPNNEAAVEALRADPFLPVDFDVGRYLRLNPDVAEATSSEAAAIDHYLRYGREEGRAIARHGDRLLRDPLASRALPEESQRAAWRTVIAPRLTRAPNVRTIHASVTARVPPWRRARSVLPSQRRATQSWPQAIAEHPRCGWLFTGFSILTYLRHNRELLAGDISDWEIMFHALEFGLERDECGWPEKIDPDFVREMHGIDIEKSRPALAALADIRRKKGLQVTVPLCVVPADLWAQARLSCDKIDNAFDHEYYRAAVQRRGLAPPKPSRGACISHFLDTGRFADLPISPELEFDADFYVQCYSDELIADNAVDPKNLDHDDLHRHWIAKGLARGLAPNLRAWCAARFDLEVPARVLEQLPIYRLHQHDLPDDTPDHAVLQHLVEIAGLAIDRLDTSEVETRGFLTELADRFAVRGQSSTAERLYWLVIRKDGLQGRPLRHLADVYQRQGQIELSQQLRETLLHSDAAKDVWTYLIVAEAYERKGNLLRAAEILRECTRTFPGDVNLRRRARDMARRSFELLWSRIADEAEIQGVQRARESIRHAVELSCEKRESVKRSAEVRHVALVGNHDLPQCTLYRIVQKKEHLEAAGYEVTVFDAGRNDGSFLASIDRFEAVIFFRVAAFPHVVEMIEKARSSGLLTFYEIDDLVFDEAVFPPPFAAYEGQIDRRNYNAMACGVPLFDAAMRLCDYGIASTTPLMAHMSSRVRTGEVFLHRNALGRKHMLSMRHARARDAARAKPVRIFYGSGTRAHKSDFHEMLEPALAATLKRFGRRVEVVLVGHFPSLPLLERYRDRVQVMEPVWDFEDYCDLLSGMDINLSVLERSVITDTKSEIKWLEAAMFGIPSVLSRTAVHEEVVSDGETGILCDDSDAFAASIGDLVENRELRARIGSAAREEALRSYSIEVQADNLAGIFARLRPPDAPARQRLMIVNVFYPPQAIGGATRVVHDNVRDLVRDYGDRFDIDVVCSLEGSQTPYELSRYAVDGVRVWAIGTPDEPDIDSKPRDPRMGEVFGQILDKVRPDIVHYHCVQRLTASVVEEARVRLIPYLITAHDGWWISPHQFLLDPETDAVVTYDLTAKPTAAEDPRMRALRRPLLGAAEVLAVSEPFADIYRAAGVERCIAVPNGVPDLPKVERVPSATGRVRLAHIGGMSRHKGFHLVRNALHAGRFENLELLVIDHSMKDGMERRETWGATPVTFRPKVPQDKVPELYARIDVLLAPSVWPESYGLVTREALHAGCWVVASDRGAIGEDVVEGEDGFVVSVDSGFEALAEVLARIDDAPDRFTARHARATRLRRNADQSANLIEIYLDLAAQRGAATRLTSRDGRALDWKG